MAEKDAKATTTAPTDAKAAPAAAKPAAAQMDAAPEAQSHDYKEYSVAEFFKKNRQMLGYSGKVRSLTTIVHEYVTNSLDAAEEGGILPDINVEIENLSDGHVRVMVEDNGIGIPKQYVGNALGKLLSGTKFHHRKQKRGQQGIGASYATLFSQITTGKPTKVKTSLGDYKIYECDITIDVKTNEPAVKNEREYSGKYRGLRIDAEFSEVTYNRSEYGVYEYLRRTAIANPHVQLTLIEPNKEIVVFPRASKEIPQKAKETLPHPLGISTSDLMDIVQMSKARKISSMLQSDFTRVSADKVKDLGALCPGIDLERAPKNLTWAEAEAIVKAFGQVKWIAPDMDSLILIGEKQIEMSLKNILQPEQMKVVCRKPRVFRGGIPFAVEAAIAYGGKSGSWVSTDEHGNPVETKGELLRFANRVPMLFDAGTCATTIAAKDVDWQRYNLKGWEGLPVSIFINFVSVYVPYTGAGKLSISAEEEIVEEIRNALMECGRDIAKYLNALDRAKDQEHRRSIFFRYIGEVAECINDLTGTDKTLLVTKLKKTAEERTAILLAQGEEAAEGLEEVGVEEEEDGKAEE
ncbi:MAG: DNA topoisomerase VI subunit B [Candidatus Micrarchaeia archaeon]|jgi:DNA topoisomerase-6 subunit B